MHLSQTNFFLLLEEIIDLIYNLSKPRVYAYKYNSHGFYRSFNTYNPAVDSGGAIANTVRYDISASRYIKNSISSLFDPVLGGTVTYQNLFRPATVALIYIIQMLVTVIFNIRIIYMYMRVLNLLIKITNPSTPKRSTFGIMHEYFIANLNWNAQSLI